MEPLFNSTAVLFDYGPRWCHRTKADPAAIALADRHYSRVKYGKRGGQVGPPGRLLVFVTQDERALRVTHWPDAKLALDGLDSWRCVLFRNEGAGLSSDLIGEAMTLTADLWSPHTPPDGWVTWVDRAEIASTNPGYCFQRAGWIVDREWKAASRKSRSLVRLRHE